jgi:plasmid stabilization system protein ParE
VAIEFSRAAEDDLSGIFLYGIGEHGLAQAERYKGQLDKTFQILSDNPKITRFYGRRSHHPYVWNV